MKIAWAVVFAVLVSSGCQADDLKKEAEKLVLDALQGKEVPEYVLDVPIHTNRFGYFLSRADQLAKENHGFHQDNLYLSAPQITHVDVSNEYIEFSDDDKTRGTFETYIARVEYLVVGNINVTDRVETSPSDLPGKVYSYLASNKIYTAYCTIYNSPIKEYDYWIVVKDPKDQKLRLAGVFPDGGWPDNRISFLSLARFQAGDRRYPVGGYPDFRRALAMKFGDAR